MLDYFVDGLLSAAKIPFSSCPVLRDRAIHSSTHGPINTATPLGVPSYVSIINIASSYHYSVTIDFPPTRRYFEHNPDLAARLAQRDVQGVYRARPVGMLVPGKQYRLYINIFGGLFSLSRPFPSPAAVTQRFRPTCSDWSSTLELCTGRPFIIHPGDSKFCSDIALVTTGATRSIVGTTVCPRPREAAAWAPQTSLVVCTSCDSQLQPADMQISKRCRRRVRLGSVRVRRCEFM